MDVSNNLGLDATLVENISAGTFNNSSYFGYKSKILKSGICKYYRRKQFDKFEWCVVEMMIFGLKSKAILTNLLNRMRILLMEEIVCIQFNSILQCIKIIQSIDLPCKTLNEKIIGMLKVCEIVRSLNRGRIVSYTNCWWRFHQLNYNLFIVPVNKVLVFKKKNDSDELLKYGEIFIYFLEKKDEKMIDIFQKLYNKTGDYGIRYRRKEAIYLLFEIIESNYKKNKEFLVLFEFIKHMFFRKNMRERRSFGIWLMLIIWKLDEKTQICSSNSEIFMSEEELKNYMKTRKKIIIDEPYVVEDYHIDKSFGLKSFGNEGSKVLDEDLSILGSNGLKYKQHYVDEKNGKIKKIEYTNIDLNFSNNIKAQKNNGIIKFLVKKKNKKITPSLPSIVDNNRKDLLRFFEIEKIEKKEIENIMKLPHGQKLTSASKKSVYVGDKFVYKGPFLENDKKLENSIKFTLALKMLEDVSNIPASMKGCLIFDIKKYKNYYFLVSKNVGKCGIKVEQSELVDTTILGKSLTEMKTKEYGDGVELPKKIKIYPRGVIKRINDIISLYPEKLTENIKTATLQHLYFRYLLDVGDSGPQNVLYREDNNLQLVSGIDMEEIRGRDQGNTKLEFLFNSKYNKKVALFGDCIEKIVTVKFRELEKYRNLFLELKININDIKNKIEKYDLSQLKPTY